MATNHPSADVDDFKNYHFQFTRNIVQVFRAHPQLILVVLSLDVGKVSYKRLMAKLAPLQKAYLFILNLFLTNNSNMNSYTENP